MSSDDCDDWDAAEFSPLELTDPGLARRLSAPAVDRFLTGADLDPVHRDEALALIKIERGVTPKGLCILRVVFPLGAGQFENEWDGSAAGAEDTIDAMADLAAEGVVWDQDNVGPTGWEPDCTE